MTRSISARLLAVALLLPTMPYYLGGSVGPVEASSNRGPGKAEKLSRGLKLRGKSGGCGEKVDVIVSFATPQGSVDDGLASQVSGEVRRNFKHLPFRAMRVPVCALDALSRNPRVTMVSADSVVTVASPPTRQTARVPGSTQALNTPNKVYKGSGVTVAVVDSGVYPHGDFYGTLLAQYDFVAPGGGAGPVQTSMEDPFGHGTHVAGMMAADGYYSSMGKYQGVATRGGVVSLRVLDADGRGQVSDVIAALDWIVDTGIATYGIRVANLSLGKAVEEEQALDPLVQAVNAVWDAGVVVVVSAGNYGESGQFTITSPGNSRKVITVGSLTDNGSGSNFADDYVSTYSSRGPTLYDHVLKPDLLAPGNKVIAPFAAGGNIASLLPPSRVTCGFNGSQCTQRYLQLSGTSMSAAVVTGAVTRMLDKDASLNPATVKARLMRSARKMAGDPTSTGAGVLDVESAMNTTGRVVGDALSPLLALSDDGKRVYVEDTARLWGGSAWSTGNLWSNGSLWSNGYAWSDGYLWSDASMWSDGYLWSDASIWSNGSIWSNSSLWSNATLWSNFVGAFSAGAQDASGPPDEAQDVDSPR